MSWFTIDYAWGYVSIIGNVGIVSIGRYVCVFIPKDGKIVSSDTYNDDTFAYLERRGARGASYRLPEMIL